MGREKICPECRARALKENRESRERRGWTAHKWYVDDIAKLKEQGLCRRCRKRPAAEGKTYCQDCLEKHNRESREHSRKIRARPRIQRSERPSFGLCYRCGKSLDRDGKICTACYSTNHRITDDERGRPASWVEDNERIFRKGGGENV